MPAVPRQLPQWEANPPQRSGQQHQPTIWPDNVYRDEAPIDISKHYDAFDITGPHADLSPDHPEGSSSGKGPSALGPTGNSIAANISQDGGAKLIYYLLSAAVQPLNGAGGDLLGNVQEWHYRDLARFPEAAQKEWKAACYEELESLDKREVFELTNLPKGHKTIGCQWVFDVKGDGARLVTQSFSPVEGIDFNKLFSPVVWFESVQLMLTLAALNNWFMTGVDVCTAYLYGKLDEEIYMQQPKGFIARGQESKVICLKRALYSLKQARLAWWKELSNSMKDLGFRHLLSDAGIFMWREGTGLIVVVVYVDDTMFFGKNEKLVKRKKALFMACQDLGDVKEFL